MAKFALREARVASDGGRVRLIEDVHDGSWFVGKTGDKQLDPYPLGAFCSKDAARKWADAHHPGGEWAAAHD